MAWRDDGTLYVLGPSRNAIRVYGANGGLLRKLGRDRDTVARAPGAPVALSVDSFEDNDDPFGWGELVEFTPASESWQGGLIAVRSDTLAVQYRLHSPLRILGSNGNLLAEPEDLLGLAWQPLTIDSLGRLWLPSTPDSSRSAWIRVRMNGEVIDTISAPLDSSPARPGDWCAYLFVPDGVGSQCVVAPHRPLAIAIPRIDGLIIAGNTVNYRFAVLRSMRDTIRVFDAPATTFTLSDAQLDSLIILKTTSTDTAAQREWRAQAKRSDIPRTTLPWSQMALDGDGRLWVGVPDWTGKVIRLQVFTREGVLLGDVPPPSTEIFGLAAWSRDRLAVVEKEASGKQVIKTFHLQTTPPK
ncbi:MAG: hypothetical protein V4558_05040 [Gemmatimonadota bacterium]